MMNAVARPKRRHARGFTLIEVLIAFVILAGSVLALMQLFSSGLTAAGRTDDFVRAVTHAESRLAEVAGQVEIAEGSTSGDVDAGRFRWTATVTPIPDPLPPAEGQPVANLRIKLLEIVVTVEFGDSADAGSNGRNVTLRTLRLVPKKVGEA
jgi:general secretion pathway protein I